MPAQRVKAGIVWCAPEAGIRCAICLKTIVAKSLPSKAHIYDVDLTTPWAVKAEVLCFDIPGEQHDKVSSTEGNVTPCGVPAEKTAADKVKLHSQATGSRGVCQCVVACYIRRHIRALRSKTG